MLQKSNYLPYYIPYQHFRKYLNPALNRDKSAPMCAITEQNFRQIRLAILISGQYYLTFILCTITIVVLVVGNVGDVGSRKLLLVSERCLLNP